MDIGELHVDVRRDEVTNGLRCARRCKRLVRHRYSRRSNARKWGSPLFREYVRSSARSPGRRRLGLLQRHEASARVVNHYDFNNAYQYILSREETQVGWLRSVVEEQGLTMPAGTGGAAGPEPVKVGKKMDASHFHHPQ
jgi:hypothetical protein